MRRGFWILKGVKVLVIIAVVLGVVSFLVMSLWNGLVPALFDGPVLTYWQALGLLVLARLLFGGFRPHGPGRWGRGGGWHGARAHWEQMTPEERERFRSRFRDCRFGGGWHGHEARESEKNGGNA
jgi:Ca2+/H+ antiporter, TMEM165/GDT1 family